MHSNNLYLSHHGIDGQQWGVKNGPPYPLDKNKAKKIKEEAEKTERKLKFSKEKARESAANAAIVAMGARMIGQIVAGPVGSAIVLGANIVMLPDAIIASVETARAIGNSAVLKYQNYKLEKEMQKMEDKDAK